MKKIILVIFLTHPSGLMGALGTMDRLRMIVLDDLAKAEYLLDNHPNLSPEQKDHIWLWMRSGCRKTLSHYSATEGKYGPPSRQNSIDIISDQIDVKIRWSRIFNKAVASGIRPVLDSDLYDEYEHHRAYQDRARDQTKSDNNPVDPE